MDLRPYREAPGAATMGAMERSIDATTHVRSPLARVCDILRDDPGPVLGDRLVVDGDRRSFPVRLTAPLGSGTAMEQEVEITLGAVAVDGGEIAVPLRWEPIGHQRLLPDFQGELIARPVGAGRTELVLCGSYRVPLGPLGRFGDSVVGHRLARQSVTDLLDVLGERIDREVDRRAQPVAHRPAPYPPDLRHEVRTDSFLG